MKIINTVIDEKFNPITLTFKIETKEDLLNLYARIIAHEYVFKDNYLDKRLVNNNEKVLANHLKELAQPYL